MKKNILAKLSPFHFLMLLIAGIINAIGVTLFIAPVQLYDSGISGTSILLSQLTPDYLSLSFFLILLNIPLLLFGFKRQGAVFSESRMVCPTCGPWARGGPPPGAAGSASRHGVPMSRRISAFRHCCPNGSGWRLPRP